MTIPSVVCVPQSGMTADFHWLPEAEVDWLFLPFINTSEDPEKLQFSVSPEILLHSILIFYQDNPPGAVMGPVRRYLKEVLAVLSQGFSINGKSPGMETMMLNATAQIRSKYGSNTAYRALKSCLEILPNSVS